MITLRQLVSDYTNIRQMLKCLYQDIEAAGEQRKNTAEYTNVAFMELMEFIEDNYKEDISLSKEQLQYRHNWMRLSSSVG